MDYNEQELRRLLDWLNELIIRHREWECHNPSGNGGSGGNGGSSSGGGTGKDGKSLEFKWQGTKLGIRVEGDKLFNYVDLKGMDGETPHIDASTMRWFIGTTDTGIPATGSRGPDGKTPNMKIGTITTLPEGSSATASITGTPENPILNLGIPKGIAGDPATNTDEKVKLKSTSTSGQYLSDLIDNSTIIVDTTRQCIKAVTLEGLEASITTLNFVKNLDKDIMTYLATISNPMTFKAVLPDDAALAAVIDPSSGDTYIVKNSASNGGKSMTFIYNGTSFEPFAETTITVRDFATNPLDLATESTGSVPETRIDPLIARLSDVLTKADYGGTDGNTVAQADTLKGLTHTVSDVDGLFAKIHNHSNKALLDSLINTGDEKRFLTNKGTYQPLVWVSSTAPTNTGIFWIDDSVATKPILKYHDGTAWKAVSSASTGGGTTVTVDTAMSSTSTNPVQNKIIKAYIDALAIPDISNAANNALLEKPDGWFVNDPTDHIDELQEEIRILRKSQYNINTDLEYIAVYLPASSSNLAVNQIVPIRKRNNQGNMELADDKIKLHAGKHYLINSAISYYSPAGTTGYNQWANILINWIDVTNNVIIGEVRGFRDIGSAAYEYTGASSYIYTPPTDCEISLKVQTVFTTDRIDPRSHATVVEIGRVTHVDSAHQANLDNGIEDTPVGTIIPMMGTTAPKHYLTCDGSVKNIADYPYLAQHFKDEFGSINYFGGNGTTTFGLPDLRGEFLRGSGTAKRNTGTGASVGAHQNGTRFPFFQNYQNGNDHWIGSIVPPSGTAPQDFEVAINNSIFINYANGTINATAGYKNGITSFTSRPTNTSVLWCIKAEPTYYLSVEGGIDWQSNEKVVGKWTDGSPLYETVICIPGTNGSWDGSNYAVTGSLGFTDFDIVYPYKVICTWKSTQAAYQNHLYGTLKGDAWIDDTTIHIDNQTDASKATFYVVVHYTKK